MESQPKYTLPHTLKLSDPVVLHNTQGVVVETIEELVFTAPITAGMVRTMPPQMVIGHLLTVVAKMTGQTDRVIDRLSWKDMQAALEVVGSFLGTGPETGENT